MQTILVVDDAPIDRRLAGKCVEDNGLRAIYAENGRQAVEVIEREKPDFVLTDMQMPEMNGLELVEWVRSEHPSIPVILMTAHGSEQIAVKALRSGAASYVPKQVLREEFPQALHILRQAQQAMHERERVRELLVASESRFLVGYEPGAPTALVSYLQDALTQLNFCDEVSLLQISTALTEAITNAVDHGNLELSSSLRESGSAYYDLGKQRAQQPPYQDRRVHVVSRLTPAEATYIVRDEGPGFDPRTLPDPTDPENLIKPSGRGIMLIRTFMDETRFNEHGNEITMVKRRQVRREPSEDDEEEEDED